MDKMLLNKSMVRKNKSIKLAIKDSKKKFGRTRHSVIKSKVGKFVICQQTTNKKTYSYPETEISSEDFIKLLETSKITGKSGGAFPVAKKIKTFNESKSNFKVLLINGTECEPGLVHDQWLIENQFDNIICAIHLIARCLNINSIYFAAKSFPSKIQLNKKEFYEESTANGKSITYKKVPAAYPMGEEHILIKQILDLSFSKNETPAANGILVMNVQTVLSILDLINNQKNCGQYVTLADLDNAKAFPVYINYGETIKDKLVFFFGEKKEYYAGTGILNAHSIDKDVFDDTISFACVANATAQNSNQNSCKGCGVCQMKCPAKVPIKKIVAIKEKDPYGDISGLGAEKCLHCNTCSFVCSAHKNLFEYLK